MIDLIISLSDRQEQQSQAIAEYDVKAAYRYCLVVASKNKMLCPVCGADLKQSSYESLICSKGGRSHAIRRLSDARSI